MTPLFPDNEIQRKKTRKQKILDFLEENIWWKMLDIWEMPFNAYREIKWFIQRGMRGYSDRDVWGMYEHMNTIIPKMLIHLSENTISYPPNLKGIKTWKKILMKMALGFRAGTDAINLQWTDKFDKKRNNKMLKDWNDSMELFKKYFYDLWD